MEVDEPPYEIADSWKISSPYAAKRKRSYSQHHVKFEGKTTGELD